jgi:Fur family transcriptional regulator, ferric uptake regulator
MSHCPTLIHELRQRGYRITPQREMIVQALGDAGDHVTAENIYDAVKDRSSAVNITTVYRTLDTLVAEGLINRTNLYTGQIIYTTQLHGPHLHLLCRQCGETISIEYNLVAPLVAKLNQNYEFEADLHHLTILGICAHCQSITTHR